MDHAEAVRMFFAPAPDATMIPAPVTDAAPARSLRDALEPIAMHDVWSSRVGDALAAHGHDFFSGYVTGRGGPFGEDAPPELIAATFAVFEPDFVGSTWTRGRALLPLEPFQALRDMETTASLREVLGADADDPAIAHTADVLEEAVDAVSGAGRPLFSALRARPRPADPVGRLWRACDLVREHRGDGHVAACVAAGLDPVRMGILAELWVGYPIGEYSGTRAWPQEAAAAGARSLADDGLITTAGPDAALTAAGRAFRDGIEAATDASQDALVEALGTDLEPVTERLAGWSARCVEAGAFPPDARKRAAG
ncbi:hypothetical protein WIS52_30920 [Pseudonocardia nematodicida]|uniref:SalK n=1 Tax=Pseudonocardia nematodicida TaxID=1206997 RepID=A0ABV1KLG4_9PSEU